MSKLLLHCKAPIYTVPKCTLI